MAVAAKLSRILMLLVLTGTASAGQGLFYEDFQDGDADGWSASGDGDFAMNEYEGNFTLRLTKQAYAVTSIPTHGADRVRVGAAFAARDLEGDDACLAQLSLDAGATWLTVSRVGDGQDDSVTMHAAAISQELPPGQDSVLFVARVAGNSADDTCWLDNVYVIGDGPPAAETSARVLDRDFLLGDATLDQPVAMAEYTMPANAAEPASRFSGALRLEGTENVGGFASVHDPWQRVPEFGEPIRHLPPFDFQFVQRGSDILPLERGVQRRDHPYWEIILQPGRAWREPGDGDWTRVSVPFSLQERSANCTHNGVLMWLVDTDDAISRVAYQISSETCGYFKFDMWGVVAAEYVPAELHDAAAAHFQRLDAHRRARLPVKPLTQLSTDHPGVDPLSFGVDDGIDPAEMSVFGLVVDGIHYRSDCYTRHGSYPYCTSLPLPSYSTAKSIFASIATTRLEKLQPGASQRTIASLIDECDRKKWRDVTIENALDMATGNFRSTASSEDEDSAPHEEFIFSDRHQQKLDFACRYFDRKAPPGTQFVYHTSDTYLVGVALGELLRRSDPDADLYTDLLVEPLWRALELSPLLDTSKRTYDRAAQPFAGYGLTYEVDDALRIASWLNDDGGALGDQVMLDERMLAASLQESPADRGLEAGSPALRYNNGFWAYDAAASLGCSEPVWVPFMSGVSGITIAMFPNGVIYYYFSDSYVFRWQSGREAAHAIRPLC